MLKRKTIPFQNVEVGGLFGQHVGSFITGNVIVSFGPIERPAQQSTEKYESPNEVALKRWSNCLDRLLNTSTVVILTLEMLLTHMSPRHMRFTAVILRSQG